MSNPIDQKILEAFKAYKDVVWNVDADIRFWKAFLDHAIQERQNNQPQPGEVYTAIFPVHNVELDGGGDNLTFHPDVLSFTTDELRDRCEGFLDWIRVLSILKVYNAMEIFLLQVIQFRFFSSLDNPMSGKDATDKTIGEIIKCLTNKGERIDKKNNRHILKFIEVNSVDASTFFDIAVRIDLKTNWRNFFELLSIIRNLISHQSSIVNTQNLNVIKSTSKDIFQRHFEIVRQDSGYEILKPIGDSYLDFIGLCNKFTLNSIKFLLGEKDLKFLELVGVRVPKWLSPL